MFHQNTYTSRAPDPRHGDLKSYKNIKLLILFWYEKSFLCWLRCLIDIIPTAKEKKYNGDEDINRVMHGRLAFSSLSSTSPKWKLKNSHDFKNFLRIKFELYITYWNNLNYYHHYFSDNNFNIFFHSIIVDGEFYLKKHWEDWILFPARMINDSLCVSRRACMFW